MARTTEDGGGAASGPTLVLGGGGFLGAHVVRALAGPVVAVRRGAAESGAPPDGAVPVSADLAAEGAAERLVREHAPARVVLVAALSRVGDCERDPGLARRLNAEVPGEVAAACRTRGARLLHVSTDLVFGARPPRAGGRYREDDPPSPAHVYGRTKAEGERAVLAAYAAALVVRLPLLYGPSGGRGLGASDSLLAGLAAGGRPTLFVDEWRTPLEVANAARALAELLDGEASGLLHVAGPDRLSRHELGCAVLELLGGPDRGPESVAAGRRADLGMADRPADASLDASRALELLATPLLGVREGLLAAGPG